MANKKISELTNYTPPIDTDVFPIVDTTTSATKKITWANIKATLKTYFDTLYGIKAKGKLTIPNTYEQDFYELTISGVASTDIVIASFNSGSAINNYLYNSYPTTDKITFSFSQAPNIDGQAFTISYIVYSA